MFNRSARLAAFLAVAVLLALLASQMTPASSFAQEELDSEQQGTLPAQTLPETPPPAETIPPMATPTPTPSARPPRPYRPPRTDAPVAQTVGQTARAGRSGTQVAIGGVSLVDLIGDRHSATLYGVTDAGWLYRTANDGRSWRLVTSRPQQVDFIMSPADPLRLYSGVGNDCSAADPSTAAAPFYRSSDGGRTWEELPTAAGLRPLLAHPTDPDRLFAADCDMPFVSDDGGGSWAAKPDQSRQALWESYFVEALDAASMVAAKDNVEKAHWNFLYAAAQAEDGTALVAYSGDEGTTWERITPLLNPAPKNVQALAADPLVAGRLWFGDAEGVWATEDFGLSWSISSRGLERILELGRAGGNGALTALLYHPSEVVFAGTSRGLYSKSVADDQWTLVQDGLFRQPAVNRLLNTLSNPGTLWVITTDGVYTYGVR
ncbi:MAG: hypothetical protein KDD78_06315 [Caldilineaceae bacterium]|nr:hypothetical protein [Caldilineaceae bacterium]